MRTDDVKERRGGAMDERVIDVELTGGGSLPVVSVELTDEVWGPKVVSLLSHKEPIYLAHLEAARSGRTPGLRTRFHLATLEGSIVSVVMVASCGRYGVLGHVYTVPEYRRRGISTQLLAVVLAEEERLGVTQLSLAVAPGSSAARIYEGHGFSVALPARDAMFRSAAGQPPLVASEMEIAPLAWRDWPGLDWAMMRPVGADEPLPRAPLFGVEERGYAEGAFLVAVLNDDPGSAVHAVLRAPDGAVAGWCAWRASQTAQDGPARLDVHVAGGFEGFLPDLIGTVGQRPCVYRTRRSHPAYDDALAGAGFERREGPAAPGADQGQVWWVR